MHVQVHTDADGNVMPVETATLDRKSKLVAYFELNARDVNAHQYFYVQLPEHYRMVKDQWIARKNRVTWGCIEDAELGRLHASNPKDGERSVLLAQIIL